jgi:hypothetical protein
MPDEGQNRKINLLSFRRKRWWIPDHDRNDEIALKHLVNIEEADIIQFPKPFRI